MFHFALDPGVFPKKKKKVDRYGMKYLINNFGVKNLSK